MTLEWALDILQIVFADIILSGDNALVIGMAAAGLAPEYRRRAIMIGMAMAAIMRMLFAVIASQLIGIKGILLLGGALLAWVCWRFYKDLLQFNSGEEAVVDAETEADPEAEAKADAEAGDKADADAEAKAEAEADANAEADEHADIGDEDDEQIEADEIIVSAGAVWSPLLLMRSGIGPASHLADHGIDVIADLPVGSTMSDHLGPAIPYRHDGPREGTAGPAALRPCMRASRLFVPQISGPSSLLRWLECLAASVGVNKLLHPHKR